MFEFYSYQNWTETYLFVLIVYCTFHQKSLHCFSDIQHVSQDSKNVVVMNIEGKEQICLERNVTRLWRIEI